MCLTVFLLFFYPYNTLLYKRQDIGRKSVATIGKIEGFLDGEADNKNELLDALLDKVVVYADKTIELRWKFSNRSN